MIQFINEIYITSKTESFFLFAWFENLERTHQWLVDAHDRAWIVELSAIIWCAKNCYQLSFCKKFVTLFDDLMRSAYQVDILLFQKIWHYVSSENEAYTSFVLLPSLNALFWIWPEQIAKKPLIRYFDRSYNFQNLL